MSNRSSGSSVSLRQTQVDSVSSLTLSEVSRSMAQVTQAGNVYTGIGDQQATLSSNQTLVETAGNVSGQGFSLIQVINDSRTR